MAKNELKLKIYSKIQESNIAIDKDLFDYGYEILNQYILFIVVSIIIALFLGTIRELLIFYFVFIPLRKNLGGFHFKSEKKCYFFSVLISLAMSYLAKIINTNIEFLISSGFILIIETVLFGCLDNSNKLLFKQEKMIFKKKGLLLELIFVFIGVICFFCDYIVITNTICFVFSFFCIGYAISLKRKN